MAEDASVIALGEPWRQYLGRGLEALRAGDLAAARRHFERAQHLAPEQPELLLALAREKLAASQPSNAAALLERAYERAPESLATAALLARTIGLGLGQRQRAFAVLHEASTRHPEAAELHVLRGELLLEDDQTQAARAAFAQALDTESTQQAARAGLARTFNAEGIALSEGGESDKAVFAFKRAANLDERWSGPLVNLGVVFGRLGKLSKAAESFRDATARDPENPVAYFNLGATCHQLGRLDEALEAFAELFDLQSDYPQLRTALANLLVDRRDYGRAIALFLEALEIDRDDIEAWASLGLAYICAGNTSRGEECLHEALVRDPAHFGAYHNLAVIYTVQRRLEAAAEVLQRAFRVDPQRTRELFARETSFAELRDLPSFRFLALEPPRTPPGN